MKFSRYILLALLCVAGTSRAAIVRSQYESVRALGMGNAFLALADDGFASFYNPAALVQFNSAHATIDTTLGVDGGDSLGRLLGYLAGTQQIIGNSTHFIRAGAPFTFATKYFGGAVIADSNSVIELEGLQLPDVNIDSRSDVGGLIGFGFPIGDHFSFGVAMKGILRASLQRTVTPAELLTELGVSGAEFENDPFGYLRSISSIGWGIGLNGGVLFRVPLAARSPELRIAATVEDFGNTTFYPFSALWTATQPSYIRSTYNFGASLVYPLTQRGRRSRRANLRVALDARDVFGGNTIDKTVNFGMELQLPGFMIRAGVFQADWTAGITIDAIPHTHIHLATYSYNLGNTIRERLIRAYVLQLTFGLNPKQ